MKGIRTIPIPGLLSLIAFGAGYAVSSFKRKERLERQDFGKGE
jgi:hypothetical protein